MFKCTSDRDKGRKDVTGNAQWYKSDGLVRVGCFVEIAMLFRLFVNNDRFKKVELFKLA